MTVAETSNPVRESGCKPQGKILKYVCGRRDMTFKLGSRTALWLTSPELHSNVLE